jgi:hypothetical protein
MRSSHAEPSGPAGPKDDDENSQPFYIVAEDGSLRKSAGTEASDPHLRAHTLPSGTLRSEPSMVVGTAGK